MLHLAWCTRNKKRELKEVLAERLKELLYECSEVKGWHIEKLEMQSNCVYMVIQFDPNVSVDAMVKTFKRTNKDMKKEYPDLDEFHMGNTFWADGYFAATEGCYDEQAVREYIAECQCEF